jgi:hypothetical protein
MITAFFSRPRRARSGLHCASEDRLRRLLQSPALYPHRFSAQCEIGPFVVAHVCRERSLVVELLARTHPQHGVAELLQESGALLLALTLLSVREQLHDQRALAADVRHHERTDLALRAETVGMQGGRLQQPAQPVFARAMKSAARAARPAEEGGDHERRLALRGRTSAAINWVECPAIVAAWES